MFGNVWLHFDLHVASGLSSKYSNMHSVLHSYTGTEGTGVAFAPTSLGVALAPTEGGEAGANVTQLGFAWQAQ